MRLSPFAPLDALIAPPPLANRVAFLGAQPFAHRGLHGHNVVENSRAAFAAAMTAGHGIELDVQAAQGGEAFVFHDDDLDRLTHLKGPLSDVSAASLDKVQLAGSHEMIPRLSEVLSLVACRVPILIEVKAPAGRVGMLCLSVRRALEGYRGDVGVMSFNPAVPRWFAEHAPRLVRGLVITESGEAGAVGAIKRMAARRFALWSAKPDFLAYDIRDLPSHFAATQRNRGLKVLTWTVRTAQQEVTALTCADEIIYEKSDIRTA